MYFQVYPYVTMAIHPILININIKLKEKKRNNNKLINKIKKNLIIYKLTQLIDT